ncbi:hypothetical protein [Paenibacillus qinlingensis]|uniref:hypothetical protein n=1 Tax=Paenibacillus qinlingensis TaxID=1837343 RepID=UPI0015632316|nr:hypothetical protein [Paenibacillus qinlingensis]NQX64030.1 hypothetical protein [Paenibacillus qinlingensis]
MKKARNGMLAFGLGCFILILAGTLSGFMMRSVNSQSDAVHVASVNGVAVEAREFSALLGAERSKTYAYFQDKYGAEDSTEFWNHSYNGEIPMEKITQSVLKQLVKRKVQQALGVQYGLLKDTSYSTFLEELRIENERRKKEVEGGRPVYGPKQVTEKVFYEMRQTQLLEDLKKKKASETAISDQDISAFYEEHRNDFRRADVNRVNIFPNTQPSTDTKLSPSKPSSTNEGDAIIPLTEVKDRIAAHLSNLSFEQFVQDQANQAQLVVNDPMLKSVAAKVLRGES